MLRRWATLPSRHRVLRHASPCFSSETLICRAPTSSSSPEGYPHAPTPQFNVGVAGHLAKGSVFAALGNTVVHATVCSKASEEDKGGFLPLTVDFRAKMAALRKIPMNNKRRERHGTDDEILASRVIDRSIRPLFPKSFKDDTQITVTTHAVDANCDPIVLGVNAASFSVLQSNLPWYGPVGCVRVALIEGKFVVNPTLEQLEKSDLDLVYTGNKYRTVMVEAIASQVPEATMERALQFAHEQIQPVIEAQWLCLESIIGSNETNHRRNVQFDIGDTVSSESLAIFDKAIELGLDVAKAGFSSSITDKELRGLVENKARVDITDALIEQYPDEKSSVIASAVNHVMSRAFRDNILSNKGDTKIISRPDGRRLDEVRPLCSSNDVLPVVHGSSFFQRGDTHVLATVTLGPKEDSKVTECIRGGGELTSYFMLHYDFPPYCTGEIGNATSVTRRMIGHGNLAEKAVRPVMPHDISIFPYSVRVSAECTSSSGSSSMATVCAASLALMDAGVPIKSHVAGVSIGLVVDKNSETVNASNNSEGEWVLLTDILGTEDYFGDMDCKIAGTTCGITAIQLDMKLPHGIPLLALQQALYKAKEGRSSILENLNESIRSPRSNIKPTAPMAVEIKFDPDRKRHLIGPGGEMIRYIESTFDVTIDTTTEGVAYIYGQSHHGVSEAELLVQDLVLDPKEGDNYLAEVTEVKDFGCVVRLTRAQEALLHISELTSSEILRKKGVSELVALGQRIRVQVIGVDREFGTVKVSRKILLKDSNEEDDLRPQLPSAEESLKSIGTLPTFPVTPPRKWSADYFLHNVASKDDVSKAMEKQSPTAVAEIGGRGSSDDVGQSAQSERLEHMVLTIPEMIAWGEEVLKKELRARGSDFRGDDASILAERLFHIVTEKQKIMKTGPFAENGRKK